MDEGTGDQWLSHDIGDSLCFGFKDYAELRKDLETQIEGIFYRSDEVLVNRIMDLIKWKK